MATKEDEPQIVKLNHAFKLAEKWVDSMSKVKEVEVTEEEPKKRQSRLGLGAKAARQDTLSLDDPVTRRLHSKITSARKTSNGKDDASPILQREDSDEDDESESRNKAFDKKRPLVLNNSSIGSSKKQK